MSRRRWILLGTLILMLAVGSELAVGRLKAPKGCVQIVNQCDTPLEELIATYDGTNVQVPRLGRGESVNIWFTAGQRGVLHLDYLQQDNPVSGFTVPDFDPLQNRRDGLKLCLTIKNKLVERSVEDDETTTPVQILGERIKRWMSSDLAPAP